VLGLFPSTAVTQPEIAKLLGQARTQVKANFAGTALPPEQSYLQPFADRRAQNLQLATNAAQYLQAASANAQNLSGAFTTVIAQRLAANQQATLQGGGSGIPAALPAPAEQTIGMNMVGSNWTNLLNALVPAAAARASEANQSLDRDQTKALNDYVQANKKRSTDIERATRSSTPRTRHAARRSRTTTRTRSRCSRCSASRSTWQRGQLSTIASSASPRARPTGAST
jgi:hypothetical protein